ncbi:MAG: hypothetical protein APF76_11095 [Desulfitibacter sp. BRH_c19]|nr:MAG: hypothetical protein APF76_11095 [Desulfitibacter sp. BRH_c19]
MKHISLPTKLYNLAYRLTGNTQLAERIALNAVENVANQGISVDNEELFQYAVKEIVDLTVNQYPYHIPGYSEEQDTSCQLQAILNTLPASERFTVVLRDICGFSSSQVAGFMNIKIEIIQQLLATGRCEVCRLVNDKKMTERFEKIASK